MKGLKKFSVIAILLFLSASLIFSLASCGNETPEPQKPDADQPEGKVTYTVKVTDYLGGTPESYIIAQIYKGEERIAMQPLDKGEATFELDGGNYTVKIDSPGESFSYDEAEATFTPEKKTAELMIFNKADAENTQTIYVPDQKEGSVEYNAVRVGEGATAVAIDRTERSYFIFTPTRGGNYEFGILNCEGAEFGYYGGIHFVMENNVGTFVDGKIAIEIQDTAVSNGTGGTAQFVFGITPPAGVDECIVTVTRKSDAEKPIPYTDILPDAGLTKYDNYLNNTLVDIDITKKDLNVVYNEADGYYHIGSIDGPVVLVKINTAGNSFASNLLLPSFVTICETDRMSKIFFDENGKIFLKESYNELVNAYSELCGSKGVRPLDKKMADAIKNTGDQNGWWTADAETSIFGEDVVNVNMEIAWLFACCYEIEDSFGSADKPIILATTSESDKTEFAIKINSDGTFMKATDKGSFVCENATGVSITVDGATYTAGDDGKLSITIEKDSIVKVSQNAEAESITFTFVQIT